MNHLLFKYTNERAKLINDTSLTILEINGKTFDCSIKKREILICRSMSRKSKELNKKRHKKT